MKSMQKYLMFTITVLAFFFARAQVTPDVFALSTTTLTSEDRLGLSTQNKNSFNISLQSQSYFQSSELADASEQVFNLEHKYNLNDKKQWPNSSIHSFSSHFILGGYANNQFIYVALPEIYYKYSQPEAGYRANLVVGRKLSTDSQLNENFRLGLTNSFFTQDFLNYQSQGLVGIHSELATKNWSFGFSALPIYLPNQGPSVKEEKGQIQGSNRWVKKPPTQFVFNDNNKEIIYNVDYDQVSKLIFNPGASAQFRIGQIRDHIYWVNSFSRRPMNEPVLERETFANLDAVGQVNLIPNVIYDQTYTSDLKFETKDLKIAISYITDRPENKIARDYHSIQTLNGLSGYGFSFENMNQIFKKDIRYGFSFAEFIGGEIIDLNTDGSENTFTFTKQRLQYKKPFQVFIDSDLAQISNKNLKIKANWLYDGEQKGSVLSSVLTLQAMKAMDIRLGFDVVGTEEQKQQDFGFLQQFQANDRVYGGLEYVF